MSSKLLKDTVLEYARVIALIIAIHDDSWGKALGFTDLTPPTPRAPLLFSRYSGGVARVKFLGAFNFAIQMFPTNAFAA